MKDKYEVIMAGSGGQGLVSCGIILAEAGMLEGKHVVQTQSYGIASRGGFSQSEVIISSAEIIFQQVQEPDIILALTEEAMERYGSEHSGIPVFYDTTLLNLRRGDNLYGCPFTAMAGEIGHVGTANIIALGAMVRKLNLAAMESVAAVLRRKFSGKLAELNIQALELGAGLIQE